MKITFLTSAHYPFDERIFYHQAKSLVANGDKVEIVSSTDKIEKEIDAIKLNCFDGVDLPKNEKIDRLAEKLNDFKPDTVICAEPLAIVAARQYRKKNSGKSIKIIYDVTEWYPSKKNLEDYRFVAKWFQFIKLLFFNLLTCFFIDGFLFGEKYKSRPYRYLFPLKPHAFIGYYPNLKYIPYKEPAVKENFLRLSYSGKISLEKGFGNFIQVLKKLSELYWDLKIEVKIIGWFDKKDESHCRDLIKWLPKNISIKNYGKQDYLDFLELISDTDIFLDLRSNGFENQRCLPIKLFDYAALGRPVIFSKIKAIRKELKPDEIALFVDPVDSELIAKLIYFCVYKPELYSILCKHSHQLAQTKYNWDKIEPRFIRFVHNL
ncbi:MAG: glycosyltransferase [Bacteroidota bacterium]|nr:glycosyltransferase [Bacteroidota bacterium]